VLIFLLMIYRKISIMDVGGSAEQSKVIYTYVKQLWGCIPLMRGRLLDGDPLTSETRLTTGVVLKCIPATEKQSRGKHIPCVVIDEACQSNGCSERALRACIQGVASEKNPMIILLSTFHLPTGLFQEYWDQADEKGFKRYRWDCVLPGTPIITGRGLLPVEQVRAGDKVLTEAGRFRQVTQAWSKQSEERVVTLSMLGHHQGIRVTAGHRVLTYIAGKPCWKEAGKLLVGDVLWVPDIQTEGKSTKSPDWYRFLGYWLGDGCVVRREDPRVYFTFGDANAWFVPDLTDLVKRLFGRKVSIGSRPGVIMCRFSHPVRETLRAYYGPNGDKFFPADEMASLSKVQAEALLTGILRTDGCSSGKVISFGSVSPSLAQTVLLLLRKLGAVASVSHRKQTTLEIEGRQVNTRSWWHIMVGGASARMLDRLAFHGNMIIPKRTWTRSKKVGGGFLLPVTQVKIGGRAGLVYDMSVEGEHSFSTPWAVLHNCFDTMEKCARGLETATPEDPYAKKFCLGCFLTYPHKVINETGASVAQKMAGCQGKARLSSGWASFDSIVESRKNNLGTNIFEVEFANERPNYAGSIYDSELVDAARVPAEVLSGFTAAAVGIDWGIETENSLCVTLGLRKLEYVYLAEAVYWDHKLVTDVAVLLNTWRNALKINFPVLADSSHPFNNTELSQAGFDVRPVIFGTWKKVGIQNVSKYLVFRRIKINVALTRMIGQMKEYRKNETSGAIVKKNDHGPDSLMSLLLNFRFEDEFGPDIEQAAVLEEQTRKMAADQFVKPPYSFAADGLKAPTVMKPVAVPEDRGRGNVLVF